MKIFGVKYFTKYFWNISKISQWSMGASCIVHCNLVSKPVKSKYLLLCMNSIMIFLLTSYTLIMFLKVLSQFIMKSKNFMKYFKESVLKYFKISMKFLNISQWNISSRIPIVNLRRIVNRVRWTMCHSWWWVGWDDFICCICDFLIARWQLLTSAPAGV